MLLNTASQNSQVGNMATDHATSSLTLHGGAVPATANDAAGAAVATHTLAGFAAPSNGDSVANAIADTTFNADTTLTYARLSNGTETLQLTVGIAGSGADVIVSTVTAQNGGASQVLSLTLSQPA